MSKFDFVDKEFASVRYMATKHAEVARDIITSHNIENMLEIGFYQGKSSAYFGAIFEDRGAGHVTTIDLGAAKNHDPNIHDLLSQAGLTHRVTPIFAKRSYSWELQKMITSKPRPQFDFCYFDGGHDWDNTTLGVLLVDMLLKPGGLLILDDMNWSISTSKYYKKNAKGAERYSPDERDAESVRLVWDNILPHLGYRHVKEYRKLRWGLAQKPETADASTQSSTGLLKRLGLG